MSQGSQTTLHAAFAERLHAAFPPVVIQLIRALLVPSPSFAIIGELLSKDPILTATVLHVANSPMYGFDEKVTSIERAAIVIGTADLFKLIISILLHQSLSPQKGTATATLFGDWRLTLWSAITAAAIAQRHCKAASNTAYLAGMLKDIPIFLALCSDTVPDFMQGVPLATVSNTQRFAAEYALWGESHGEIASNIIEFWGLPVELAEAVKHHHDYAACASFPPLVQSVIWGTRWAELIIAEDADVGALVGFEISLAHELRIMPEELQEIRDNCALGFTTLATELGLLQGENTPSYYDQNFMRIQSAFFLASEAVGFGIPDFTELASTIKRQLQIFSRVESWQLFVQKPEAETGIYFNCVKGVLRPPVKLSMAVAFSKVKQNQLRLEHKGQVFGFLSFDTLSNEEIQETHVALYVHILGKKLGEQFLLASLHTNPAFCFEKSMLPVAKLNMATMEIDASCGFLALCGKHLTTNNFISSLHQTLGISSAYLQALLQSTDTLTRQRTIISGLYNDERCPIYLSFAKDPFDDDVVYAYADAIPSLSPSVHTAIAYEGFLDALISSTNAEAYLLDATGKVLWAPASFAHVQGKNIFAISQSSSVAAAAWNASYLYSAAETQAVSFFFSAQPQVIKECTLTAYGLGENRFYVLGVRPSGASAVETAKNTYIFDGLTGLYNFSHCCQIMQKAIDQVLPLGKQVGIIYCDIANFSQLNAKHGPTAGDAVLRRVATCLRELGRKGVDINFRVGADEFVHVALGVSQEVLEQRAVELVQLVEEKCQGAIAVHMGLKLLQPQVTVISQLDFAKNLAHIATAKKQPFVWNN